MTSLLKNFVVVLFAMLAGAATVIGYLQFQGAPTAAPLVASAASSPAPAPALGRLGLPDENILVSIYDSVSPAVVNITNRGQLRRSTTPQLPERPGLPQLPQQQPPEQGTGSGVIIDDQGHILTNNHVVDGADSLQVSLADGSIVPAKLLGRDPGNDLAVLKIDVDRSKLTVARLGDSSKLKAGQWAIAIGNPFGLDRTITLGVISSVRTHSGGSGNRPIRDMIQTDAAINPGNSGGPLLNSAGELIGITTSIESPVRGSVGIGFAVPINTAQRYLADLIAGRNVSHPWLGISGAPVSDTLATELGISAGGVYVVQVLPDSPALDAGLRGAARRASQTPSSQIPTGGDVILAVDGQKVGKTEDISAYLDANKKPGDRVTLTVLRDGANKDVVVTLGEWPDSPQ